MHKIIRTVISYVKSICKQVVCIAAPGFLWQLNKDAVDALALESLELVMINYTSDYYQTAVGKVNTNSAR